MQNHLDQVSHNENFHACISSEFNNNFYDWKITVLFYIGLHCLQALAASKGINIGNTHTEVERNVNPDRTPTMAINRQAWRSYKALYQYSRSARYEGVTDIETYQDLKRIDHEHCVELLSYFKKYIEGQGVSFF